MKASDFGVFFKRATGFEPFPYQEEMATRDRFPSLVSVPTGLGKTAAAILAWLWRRRCAGQQRRLETPRRLVYCLPMRVLVEQTRENAVVWLHRLGMLAGEAVFEKTNGEDRLQSYDPLSGDETADKVRVHLLMGGDLDRDWDRYPERDAILVGTQDMLLSRALNRGYAMSRFRWPVPFGLLNNDCLWVIDEVQLMGNGLATTTQLQAFRRKMGTAAATRSVWMSATVKPDWLHTVDFEPSEDAPTHLDISDNDRNHPALRPRFTAQKKLEEVPSNADDGKTEAELLLSGHRGATTTLMVANTVKRAQAIFSALQKAQKRSRGAAELVLLHSRFRSPDREKALKRLLATPSPQGTIAVSTQVVEAGVDVSARLLVTDLAPWASMVQRFGRANRRGEIDDARVIWIRPAGLEDDKKHAPYDGQALRASAARLVALHDVGLELLPEFTEELEAGHVIRKKDMLELFDTTPDLAGADVDVSRFIREADEHHVQVFWRDVDKGGPGPDESGPRREELCSVPLGDLKNRDLWRWDHLDGGWVKVRGEDLYPGQVVLKRADDGGYDPVMGWTGKSKARVAPIEGPPVRAERHDGDRVDRRWQTLTEHTDAVISAVKQLSAALAPATAPWRETLLEAAKWHDVGKAHPGFQEAMKDPPRQTLWAKSPGFARYRRVGFRHELASAVAALQNGQPDLVAYLAAAHHGKVRMSIRSMPHEKPPEDDLERLFARGVWDGDILPVIDLGPGITIPETILRLSYMELGEDEETGSSWLARMLALRDDPELGPFRLVFLEAVTRIADWRASAERTADWRASAERTADWRASAERTADWRASAERVADWRASAYVAKTGEESI